MSLKYNMKFYSSKVETRLNDSMHQLSGKSKLNIRTESQLIAENFKEMGYKVATKFCSPTLITQQDFRNLANFWKEKKGYSTGTMQDKASVLRHILQVAGNTKAVLDNKALGIQSKERDILNSANENRGCRALQESSINSIKDNSIKATVKLIINYGLRRDEALHATWAISKGRDIGGGGILSLQSSWTKNGRARSFQMADGGAALKQAAGLVKGFEIKGRIEQFRGRLDRQFSKLKTLDNNPALHPHALRHNYAQSRYLSITGLTAPSAGGLSYEKMDKEQKSSYNNACGVIALEMGHARPEISTTYIGH